MRVRAMTHQDLPQVNQWLKGQNMQPVRMSDLPIRMYIVPGVAAAGVRCCEGGYGMMDSLCTNPLVSSATRHKASVSLWNKILSIPDFSRIIGYTSDAGTLERALRHGFRVIAQSVLVKSQEAE